MNETVYCPSMGIDLDTSIFLYKTLVLLRFAEERVVEHYPDDGMKTPMHMSMGQEAGPTGVCAALGDRAQVISSYRSHAPFLARTKDPDKFFAEMYGKVTGTADGKSGSMHLSDPDQGHLFATGIVAAGIAPAVGAAYANKFHGNGKIVATFFGDGAVDQGVFWESLNVGSLMKLPVLFVCEDNGYAVHTPREQRHGFESLEAIAKPFDCEFFVDDTNDVESIYTNACRAAAYIDEFGGPVLFQIKCERYLEHVGIGLDFDRGYRTKESVDAYRREKDCIKLQRSRLIELGVSEAIIDEVESEILDRVVESVRRAKAADFPSVNRLYRGVFHENA